MARSFGATWWGRAWIDALEAGALADPNRLSRGRTYARQDRVHDIEVEPGLIRALVEGTETYTAQLGVRELSDERWDELLDTTMERAAYSAALLSGEVPTGLGDMLLPRAGDLSGDCSCPDWGDPCKHIAALCYLVADTFDADPFALLLVRGRGRDGVLAEIRRRRSAALGITEEDTSDSPRGRDPGTKAADAWRREPEPLTRSFPLPRHPGSLVRLDTAPPAGSGINESELRALVADAATRAHRMLAGDGNSGLGLSASADVVRRASEAERDQLARISAATKVPLDQLQAAAGAWRHGRAEGLRASRQRWDPPDGAMAPGVAAIARLGDGAKVRRNAVSLGSVQLRLDEHGVWWRFDTDDELGWVLSAPGTQDPEELIVDGFQGSVQGFQGS